MIERAKNPQIFQGFEQSQRKVLHMRQGDRTAGSMPVWEKPATAKQAIEANIAAAQNPGASGPDALAFQQNTPVKTDDEFGFSDLLDMINPLQHIPIVSHFYREMTGDSIKPASQIIGGAVFGGALGAAGGLVNVVIEEETGNGVTENAMAYATTGKVPHFKNIISAGEEERTASYARETLPETATSSWAAPEGSKPADFSAALLAYNTAETSAKPAETSHSAFKSFTLNA